MSAGALRECLVHPPPRVLERRARAVHGVLQLVDHLAAHRRLFVYSSRHLSKRGYLAMQLVHLVVDIKIVSHVELHLPRRAPASRAAHAGPRGEPARAVSAAVRHLPLPRLPKAQARDVQLAVFGVR
eukprot:CAMPEP_0181373458 /NCGR_PEP_ID=MMETSP1106-20121128/15392_1 /TAXON_ID=81844 /ORGANISM="Mantoniella antarctica, Strain SL-175" /LENGTH=126 /DNA_ID=CAMNT_0023491163 /DNA_START=379 /DNA_END=759 /DNA_ORIENTATION=+